MSSAIKKLNHIKFYKGNKKYEKFLFGVNRSLYNKYVKFIFDYTSRKDNRILDVGCGVGTVIHQVLRNNKVKAFGIDVSANFIKRARKGKGNFKTFDGKKIPYTNKMFDVVGCFTVLEHVNNPEELINEMLRVLKNGGRIVIAGPSFLRVVGFSATHYKTRGLMNSIENFGKAMNKYFYSFFIPDKMGFEFMKPVTDKSTFDADDDAICVTNMIDVRFLLKRAGIKIIYQSGLVDTSKSNFVNFISEIPILRDLTGGYFIAGIK